MTDLKNKVNELYNSIKLSLVEYDFHKKTKNRFYRKQNECTQYITLIESKVRGSDSYLIEMVIGFKFDDIDKMVYQLKGLEYDDRFLTASFSLSALMPDSYIFGFRIFNDTLVDDIASQIIDIIKEYAFPIFDSADTLDKYKEKLISKDDTFVKGSNSSNGTEWNLLAIAVLYNNELIQTILKDYNKNFNLREQFFLNAKQELHNMNFI